jgi:hypothetical protein
VYIKNEEAADDIRYASSSALNIAQVTAASTQQFLIDSKALLLQLAQRARTQPINRATCTSLLQDFTDLPSWRICILEAKHAGIFVADY